MKKSCPVAVAYEKKQEVSICDHNWVMYEPFRGDAYECCSKAGCGITKKEYVYKLYNYAARPDLTDVSKKAPTEVEMQKIAKEAVLFGSGYGRVAPKASSEETDGVRYSGPKPTMFGDAYDDGDTQLLLPGFDPDDIANRLDQGTKHTKRLSKRVRW